MSYILEQIIKYFQTADLFDEGFSNFEIASVVADIAETRDFNSIARLRDAFCCFYSRYTSGIEIKKNANQDLAIFAFMADKGIDKIRYIVENYCGVLPDFRPVMKNSEDYTLKALTVFEKAYLILGEIYSNPEQYGATMTFVKEFLQEQGIAILGDVLNYCGEFSCN